MYTNGHAVLNVAALSAALGPQVALPALVGAVLPDLPVFALYFRERARGTPEHEIWAVHYNKPGWLALIHGMHGLPTAGAVALAGLGLGSAGLLALGLSMAAHALCDLPVHGRDAHRHFLPFTHWRFISPWSYWDPARHARKVGLVEMALVGAAALWLWSGEWSIAGRAALLAATLWYPWNYWRCFLRSREARAS